MKGECDFSSNRFLMWPYEMRNTATMTCSHGQFNSSDWSFCPCAIQLDHSLYKRETLAKREIQKVWEKEILREWMGGKSDRFCQMWMFYSCEAAGNRKTCAFTTCLRFYHHYTDAKPARVKPKVQHLSGCFFRSHLKQHAGLSWTTKIQASHIPL